MSDNDYIEYKGFMYRPSPQKKGNPGYWYVHISIVTRRGRADIDNLFEETEPFSSEEEAKQRSIEFAKEIIDGKGPKFKL